MLVACSSSSTEPVDPEPPHTPPPPPPATDPPAAMHVPLRGASPFWYADVSIGGQRFSLSVDTEHDALIGLANSLGMGRVLITPDPTQRTKYAIRAWRWAYTSDCLDQGSAAAFARAHIRHGREDIDADVPIPFDPTTTNVPCHDLMAAPDSCN